MTLISQRLITTMNTTQVLHTKRWNATVLPHTNATTKTPILQPESGLQTFEVIIIVMCIPCFIAAVIGNFLVIAVRVRALRQVGLSAYKLLICFLSIADIIYSTAIPVDIYDKINKKKWIQNGIACKLLLTTQSASLTASIGIMTVMAFERFQGVSDPLRHHWSTKKVVILTVLIWIYSYVNFIPYGIALDVVNEQCGDYHYPSNEFAKWYTLYQFISSWLVPLMLIICFHFGMIAKVITHRKTIRKSTYHRTAIGNGTKETSATRTRNRKMIKILIVIVTLFAVLTLPIHIWFMWYEYSDRSETANYDLKIVEVFATLVYLHCSVNPIIYSIMDRKFREDIWVLFGLKSLRKQEPIPMRTLNGDTTVAY